MEIAWPDLVNGLLEIGGATLLIANLRAIRADKQLMGIRWYPTAFFTVWSMWNLFYYPSLNQWISFVGGALMAVVNALWLGHVWYYWRASHTVHSDVNGVRAEALAKLTDEERRVLGI